MSTTQAMRQLIDENATIKAELERLRADVQHWREARDAALAEGDLMRQELERLRTESEMRRIALLDEMQSAERLRAQVAPSSAHQVAVSKAALQMVRNALRNDAEAGKTVRAEMLAELDKATFELSAAPAQQAGTSAEARDATRWRAVAHAFHITDQVGERTGQHAVKLSTHWAAWIPGKHASVTDAIDAYVAATEQQETAHD